MDADFMRNVNVKEFNLNERILQQLLLRSPYETCSGLYDGKMGLSIFFFSYAKYTENYLFVEIAEELLRGFWSEIKMNLPVEFNNGILGIGWGIEYLIQNGFVDGNSNDICEELDVFLLRAIKSDLYVHTDSPLVHDMAGLSYYVAARINGSMKQHHCHPFSKDFILSLDKKIRKLSQKDSCSCIASHVAEFCRTRRVPVCDMNIRQHILPNIHIDSTTLHCAPLGIHEGLAGYLFNNLSRVML